MLIGKTAIELAALVQTRQTTAFDVVSAHLAHIATHDPQIGAFQLVRAARALEEARAIDARPDRHLLPLAGVPVAIKDNVPVSGEPMRVGSLATPSTGRDRDHETVRRLRAAGAVIVGTTRVPELCAWATTDGAFGVTRNPWDLERTAGGSSGGSAAAVAAAMVPLALGADGMGSIRIPAACCGIVGIKPGRGAVPADLGVSSWFGLAENGALADAVSDAALMLSVLAGREDWRDPAPPGRPLRIALSARPPLAGVRLDRELRAAAQATADLLAAAGHHVEASDPPSPSARHVRAIFAHWFAGVAEDAAMLDRRTLQARTRTHARFGRIAERLGLVRSSDRDDWRRLHAAFFRRFDVLLTPALATIPIRADRWSDRSWLANVYSSSRFAPYAAAWNFAGYPAAAVPAGLHSSGMPIAIQLVAADGGERTILSVARQIEVLQPWRRCPPSRGR